MPIRVIVDTDLCESNERCVEASPTVFKVNEQDELVVLTAEPSEALLDELREAERICPRGAITIVEQ